MAPKTSRAVKPNIIFILADDLGYDDLGCQAFVLDDRHTEVVNRKIVERKSSSLTYYLPGTIDHAEGHHAGESRFLTGLPPRPMCDAGEHSLLM